MPQACLYRRCCQGFESIVSSFRQHTALHRSGVKLAIQDQSLSEPAFSTNRTLRFWLIGGLACAADYFLFNAFMTAGVDALESSLLSFLAASIFTYTLGFRSAIANIALSARHPALYPYILVIGLLALLLRGAVLELLLYVSGWPARLAIVSAVASTSIAVIAGSAFFIFPRTLNHAESAARARKFALAIAACSLILRLLLSATTDLIPEEAYYWNYAQHLDLGYVDHPPMVAWMIACSTRVLGDSEFAVRLPAILCWLATAYFMFRWTECVFGKTGACLVLMFLATFPFFFSIGFLVTPDAPLTAAWAGCLWWLTRALLDEHRGAWLGVGVFAGLGMLSKYTIALLGPAALVFVLLDARSRQWLSRREPYQAILIAALLFSPVVVWNANHEWASFLYQGPDRWSSDIDFSLHILILSALVLVTPFGMAGIVLVSLPERITGLLQSNKVCPAARMRLFTSVFTLVPLSVFVLHSLQDNPKIQWTGPVWLAALPALASAIDPQRTFVLRRLSGFFSQNFWKPVAIVMLLLLGGAFYAMTVGPPLLPQFERMSLPVAWEEMMQSVDEIENEVALETGAPPIVVGLSNYFISAEHAFYDRGGRGVEETGGRGLLGYNGWMWDYWQEPEDYAGRNFILVTFEPEYQIRSRFQHRFAEISDIKEVQVVKSGRPAGRYYYRIGYAYQPPA